MDTENSSDNSLHLAYGFVTHSYEWGLSRLDAVERRLQGLLVYLATVTFAPPVAIIAITGEAYSLDELDWRAVSAFGVFVLATMLLVVERTLLGGHRIPDPEKLFEEDLSKTPLEFMETTLYRASQDLKATLKLVNRKTRVADIVVWLILLEIVLWLLSLDILTL